ncbi:MAG: hypothetical protein OXC63_15930 [Aestuariivita sp.]|nr:hypothetical protein [Aestuariivita sp.]MCY4346847.1 hypothetical protein [Aestuariivita sp.]
MASNRIKNYWPDGALVVLPSAKRQVAKAECLVVIFKTQWQFLTKVTNVAFVIDHAFLIAARMPKQYNFRGDGRGPVVQLFGSHRCALQEKVRLFKGS